MTLRPIPFVELRICVIKPSGRSFWPWIEDCCRRNRDPVAERDRADAQERESQPGTEYSGIRGTIRRRSQPRFSMPSRLRLGSVPSGLPQVSMSPSPLTSRRLVPKSPCLLVPLSRGWVSEPASACSASCSGDTAGGFVFCQNRSR